MFLHVIRQTHDVLEALWPVGRFEAINSSFVSISVSSSINLFMTCPYFKGLLREGMKWLRVKDVVKLLSYQLIDNNWNKADSEQNEDEGEQLCPFWPYLYGWTCYPMVSISNIY